jgi:hypothetical protein
MLLVDVSASQPPSTPPPPPQISLEKFYIYAISWNGDYWLLGGAYPVRSGLTLTYKPILLRFDGTSFIDLAPLLDLENKIVDQIVWNGDYWLIAYSFHEYGGLKKYDGEVFSDISLPGRPPTLISSMRWNGEYWLIGSSYLGFGYLLRYDGREVRELTSESKLAGVSSISWVKDYWLISGTDHSGAERLMKYDGFAFTDVSNSLPSGIYYWNGEYWLVTFDSKLLKYDGIKFIDLSEEMVFGKEQVSAVAWNGEYWLIGGEKGKLMEYDGVAFTDITHNAGLKGIEAIAWGEGYWLVGGPGTLKKYDGSTFTDLTPQLNAALPPSWPINPIIAVAIAVAIISILIWKKSRSEE